MARGLVLDDRYRIDEVVGVGGMSTVYRARDELLGRDVAVKLFPPTPSADDLRRQEAEIAVLAQLNHPNLVILLDAGSAFAGGPAPRTYIVMEFVAGPTLAALLKACLLYTSDAADEEDSVDLGGRRIIKKKNKELTAKT